MTKASQTGQSAVHLSILLQRKILRNQLDRDCVALDPCRGIFRISRGTIRKHHIPGFFLHAARDFRLQRDKGLKRTRVKTDRAKLMNPIACLDCKISDSIAIAVELHECALDALLTCL
jgi:hypothetical protein